MSSIVTRSATGFHADALAAFLEGRDEPSWFGDRRRAALERFIQTPLPTLRDEEWRRTDLRGLKLDQFGPVAGGPASPSEALSASPAWSTLAETHGAGFGVHHRDGRPATHPASAPELPAGVVFTDLATALKRHPDLIQRHLGHAIDTQADAFALLQSAFVSGGVVLYVPQGVKLDHPLFHLIELGPDGRSDFNHTLVILEKGAEATFIQETASTQRPDKTPALHVGAVELFVGERAKLRFVNIQNWDRQTWHFSRERAVVAAEGALQWTVGGLGARLAKVNQDVALAGPRARAQVNGVLFTTGRQHLAYFTRQDHQAPQTTSDLLYKGGLTDHSRLVWKGMIRVEPDAQKTDAYQKNDSLILSPHARSDSIPGLEIEANDVRCTHGATAGPIDPEMLFYCRSRGLGREESVRLIVEGFFANVYDRISLESARATLETVVAQRFAESVGLPADAIAASLAREKA